MGFYRTLYYLFGWDYYGKSEMFDEKQRHLKYKLNNEIIFRKYVKSKELEKRIKRQKDIAEFNKYRLNNEFKFTVQMVNESNKRQKDIAKFNKYELNNEFKSIQNIH